MLLCLVEIKAFISLKDLLADLNINSIKMEDRNFVYLESKKEVKDFFS
jgi:hypothetical protein